MKESCSNQQIVGLDALMKFTSISGSLIVRARKIHGFPGPINERIGGNSPMIWSMREVEDWMLMNHDIDYVKRALEKAEWRP